MKKNEMLVQFSSAYERLKEALSLPLSEPLTLDGTIQRFEFTFELAWKTLKAFLEDEGIRCYSPKSCLKEAFRIDWIKDEKHWIELLQARNMTAHVYNEEMAMGLYEVVKNCHPMFESVLKELKGK